MAPNNKNGVEIASLFAPPDILCHATQTDRDAIISALVTRLTGNYADIGHAETILKLVLAREQSASTVLAPGVALPHARIDAIRRPYLAVATSTSGILFTPDQPRVHTIILLLVPKEQPALYLQILHALNAAIRADSETGAIRACATPEAVMRFFQFNGQRLPDFVCAADIMAAVQVTLKENDSLKTAIDLFVDRQLIEIPVVDKDGDLVGVVSASSLLHVCLPDYLLWMDDLTPIRNFEPFATVLRSESNTWLGEILSENFAFVQVHSPAIAVAAELSRQNTTLCYVLDGKRLMGTINLQRLLHKVFRE